METQKADEKEQKKEPEEVNVLDDASLLNQGPPDPKVEEVYLKTLEQDEHLYDPSSQEKTADTHSNAARKRQE